MNKISISLIVATLAAGIAMIGTVTANTKPTNKSSQIKISIPKQNQVLSYRHRRGYWVCYRKMRVWVGSRSYRGYPRGYYGRYGHWRIRYVSCQIYKSPCYYFNKFHYGWYPSYRYAKSARYRCWHTWY